ncbi:hypothetical protein LDE03_04370 [Lactobacillus delbrueckii subsp. delbrueckii]|nr:hypothetical protein LDE01_10890 [Lactobacillus delbrueckii subsp. delbrueckii]GEA74629.1 hypothetical protein LDE03_04370 [Lactobacillus delbrueckii subsp. delbrueckii]
MGAPQSANIGQIGGKFFLYVQGQKHLHTRNTKKGLRKNAQAEHIATYCRWP